MKPDLARQAMLRSLEPKIREGIGRLTAELDALPPLPEASAAEAEAIARRIVASVPIRKPARV